MKSFMRHCSLAFAALMVWVFVFAFSACSTATESSNNPIQEVTAIGMVDYDGCKLKAMALKYEQNLAGADVSEDTYEIGVFDSITPSYIGNGKIGDIVDVYVNDKAEVSETGGSGSGNYVIIEVFTDYLAANTLNFTNTMAAKAMQVKDITLANGTVIAAYNEYVYNLKSAKGKVYNFTIPEISGFKFYTNEPGNYGADGAAYTVENCFSQIDGSYTDIELSYALYLPEDYNENGNYAMLTLENPAASAGTHPLVSVLATRSPSVYASEWAQELVKETHPGIDGLIVVVPVVTQRVDDNGGTPAEYQAIVSLWDHIIETYHVDTDYVYGTGESVGGMILLETNRNRDNFFAGILLYNNQWAQNYYVDTIFTRNMITYDSIAESAELHYPRIDGDITWDYYLDTDGNKVYDDHDPYNYFYLVSDDNIMITNTTAKGMSNTSWMEMKYLYYDLAGYDLRQHVVSADLSLEEQSEDIRNWTQRTDDALNINWISFEGEQNARKIEACYEWLLTQSRQTEIKRDKLDLNKPFEIAGEPIETEERKLDFTDVDGNPMYFLHGKAGAGTRFYNSYWGNVSTVADAGPGWLPEGMSWATGVGGANIVSVTKISDKAIAIEYDADMSGLVINLKGDKVYNHIYKTYRDDDFVTVDPYVFVDDQGNTISCSISNVYVNATAATDSQLSANSTYTEEGSTLIRRAGSGYYVIVELDEAVTATVAGVIQQTTLRTNYVIANASYIVRGVVVKED